MEFRQVMTTNNSDTESKNSRSILKFIIWSFLGSFVFFVPISLNNETTIPLDHILTAIETTVPWFGPIFALIVITIGGILPFYDKSWNRDAVTVILSILKLLGIGAGFMAYFSFGPDWLLKEDVLPFLWTAVAVPVAIIVPLGSIFLTFILCYGLLEFIGVLMRPIMHPVWKLPGRAAVDAATSFVGSFAIAMFMTNRIFKDGKYTEKEAAIILTGFSSVSVPFMIIVAKKLDLMESWNMFFWTALLVTYLASAITTRLYPLRSIRNEYYRGSGKPESSLKGNLLRNALRTGIAAAGSSGPLHRNIGTNLKDGMFMTFRLISTIISVGLISFVLVKTTPVFDYIGYIFYPFTYVTRLPDPDIVAKLTAVAGAEMFIPSAIIAGTPGVDDISKFVVGVVSIALILFFSGSIPCILATDVRLGLKNLVIIMVERAILALLIVAPIAHFLF